MRAGGGAVPHTSIHRIRATRRRCMARRRTSKKLSNYFDPFCTLQIGSSTFAMVASNSVNVVRLDSGRSSIGACPCILRQEAVQIIC